MLEDHFLLLDGRRSRFLLLLYDHGLGVLSLIREWRRRHHILGELGGVASVIWVAE